MTKHSRSWRNLPARPFSRTAKSFSQKSSYNPRRKRIFFLLIKKCAPFLGIAILLSISLTAGAFWWYSRELPDPNRLIDRDIPQTTKIYDKTGEHVLYEIHGEEKRTLVRLAELPDYVKWAAIALEDKNFYKHKGFDYWGIIRAMFSNVASGDLTGQGGSTITQQLVKNAILTKEKVLSRKIKELILAHQLEKKFSKDEILQMYLNEIPYGSNAYGIQSASQTFFGKDAQALTIAESALLASLPNAPSRFSPYGSHKDDLLGREKKTLKAMHDQGYINDDEFEKANNQELVFKPRIDKIEAPHFVFYIKEQLSEKYGETMVEQGGLKVITTLDYDKQKAAEKAIADMSSKIEASGGSNAALAAIDPKTGQILAMVGSRDFFNQDIDGQVNVTIRPRQPGSSFKPMVYTAAFRKGYSPSTILYDVVTDFDPRPDSQYAPKNYTLKEYGPVTMRQALQGSLNIPAVKTLYLVGVKTATDLAKNLGYTTLTNPDRYGLALVLGGGEVKLLEHTGAFGVLANEGIRNPIVGILKVESPDGKVLEEFKESPTQVLDAQTARLTNNILSDNQARTFIFGANSALQLGSRPVAAKTGTTNDYKDAWTLGYTPSLAAGVWVGNNDNTPMKGEGGSTLAAPIWNAFMRAALANTQVEQFTPPESINTGKPVLDGISGERKIKIDRASKKLATEFTPISFVEEKTFRDLHSILHYVQKDNPRGDRQSDPSKDPQYGDWEAAIARWAKENNIVASDESAPTESDDVHTPQNRPSLTVYEPTTNSSIKQAQLIPSLAVSAPRGVSRVEYLIDEILWDTVGAAPYVRTLQLDRLGKGEHILRVTALDDIDNSTSIEIPFIYEGPSQPTGQNTTPTTIPLSTLWLSPTDKSTIPQSSFPLTLTITVSPPSQVKRVNYYYSSQNNIPIFIDSTREPTTPQATTTWRTAPPPGTYTLYANSVDSNNVSHKTNEVTVVIQ
ncbi:MAG: Penicillin-binding protein, 1A family [Parcubacteria group bacterium GW2011_GWA2_43_13]|nr:MAG: Penicillin-binding protein, 1A family [Parcubacteria group bacterium GW2011_GWA2_43_13]HAZ16714.1 hypothetical protein [Candidatus Jacksonbacteria bacterium]